MQGSNGQTSVRCAESRKTAGLGNRGTGTDRNRRPEHGRHCKDLTKEDSVTGSNIAQVMTLSWSESASITHTHRHLLTHTHPHTHDKARMGPGTHEP